MNMMFDEAEKYWRKVYSETNFHLTFSFLCCEILNVFKLIQHIIQHAIIGILDEISDWFAPPFTCFQSKVFCTVSTNDKTL